ncbi:MAG TPA: 50S ribosomal protein L25 [Candidatus Paceibacterota bacterium]
MLTLEVKPRGTAESAQTIRAQGSVPAVLYGPKEASTAIAIDARTLEHAWKQAGETTIVTLKGAGADKDTLIRDVQVHPVTGRLLHADFYVLEKGKKIEIAVPLAFTGEAPAEKQGHIISKALHEIEIEVVPAELPHNLPVDISRLENVGDHITASQIPLPPSATLLTHGDETVVSVTAFVEEKIESAAPPPVEVAVATEQAEPVPEGVKSEKPTE